MTPAVDGQPSDDNNPYSREWYSSLKHLLGEHACRMLGFYEIPSDFVLSVVIPAYNEEATLREIVRRVASVPVHKEIILVDDRSRDRSREIMQGLPAEFGDDHNRFELVTHSENRGKGAAVRTGFAKATGDVVVVQDADLEYDPAEFPRLLQPILSGQADAVFGSRFLGDHAHRVLYYWHYLGNQCLSTLSNCFSNLNLTDMETCYKMFRRTLLAEILPTLKQDRFGFEPEITVKIAR